VAITPNDASCVMCFDRKANQMPFRCQHVLVCGSECTGRMEADDSVCAFCSEGWARMCVVQHEGPAQVRHDVVGMLTTGRRSGRCIFHKDDGRLVRCMHAQERRRHGIPKWSYLKCSNVLGGFRPWALLRTSLFWALPSLLLRFATSPTSHFTSLRFQFR
jgi:hypothetical protein